MIQFMREGGVVIHFVFLFGIIGLVLAAATVYRPSAARLAVCENAQRAVLFTTLAGWAAGVNNCLRASSLAQTPAFAERGATFWRTILFEGMSEALNIPIAGFALLGLIALLTTAARMRVP